MRFGVNTFVWESPFSTDLHLGLFDKARSFGCEVLEIAVEAPELVDVKALRRAAADSGLGLLICGAFGPDRNLSSADRAIRANAENYLRWLIDAASEVASPIVSGPMYSAVGKERLATGKERAQEWERAVYGLRALGEYAAERNVRLAFEALNRFENDMINVVDQGLALIRDIGSSAVGLHLDTFHMHLEEKDSAAAIERAGDRLFHFHACENDRGVPGTGQVHWRAIAGALHRAHYDGAVVIESFTPQVASIAKAVCIWRTIAPDQDTIARDGLAFLRTLLNDHHPA